MLGGGGWYESIWRGALFADNLSIRRSSVRKQREERFLDALDDFRLMLVFLLLLVSLFTLLPLVVLLLLPIVRPLEVVLTMSAFGNSRLSS